MKSSKYFKETSTRSSSFGREGFRSPEDFQHFSDKYRAGCIAFIAHDRPWWKDLAIDATD